MKEALADFEEPRAKTATGMSMLRHCCWCCLSVGSEVWMTTLKKPQPPLPEHSCYFPPLKYYPLKSSVLHRVQPYRHHHLHGALPFLTAVLTATLLHQKKEALDFQANLQDSVHPAAISQRLAQGMLLIAKGVAVGTAVGRCSLAV